MTERQKQVIMGVANGLTAKQIAEQLAISADTVEDHKTGAKRFLNTTTAGLIHYALARGWVKNKYGKAK